MRLLIEFTAILYENSIDTLKNVFLLSNRFPYGLLKSLFKEIHSHNAM